MLVDAFQFGSRSFSDGPNTALFNFVKYTKTKITQNCSLRDVFDCRAEQQTQPPAFKNTLVKNTKAPLRLCYQVPGSLVMTPEDKSKNVSKKWN